MGKRNRAKARDRAQPHTPVRDGHLELPPGATFLAAGMFVRSSVVLNAGESPQAAVVVDLTGRWNHGAADKLTLVIHPRVAKEGGHALQVGSAAALRDLVSYLHGDVNLEDGIRG